MRILLSICLLSFNVLAVAQGDAKINNRHKNISSFIKIWGFLKYHHPAGIKGSFDADKVFLDNIEQIKDADLSGFNKRILNIMAELDKDPGIQQSAEVPSSKDQLLDNINFSWTKDTSYSVLLRSKLLALTKFRNPTAKHFYIPTVHYTADIPNEKTYSDYTFNQEAMNLLALAKAWNAIEYLFPHKYIIGKDWTKSLKEMVPVFLQINGRTDYEKAVLLLEVAINDTHASGFIKQMKNKAEVFHLKYYPPFAYQVYQRKILIKAFLSDSLAKVSKLMVGDQIKQINGVKVAELLKTRYKLQPASNMAVKDRLLSTGENDTGSAYFFADLEDQSLSVQVLRKGKSIALTLNLLDYKNSNDMVSVNRYFQNSYKKSRAVKGYEDLSNETALFRAGYFFDNDLPDGPENVKLFSERLKSKKAIIFDMRAYPQAPGLFYNYIPMALGISAFKFARYYEADLSYPGAYVYDPSIETYLSADLKSGLDPYKGKIIILTSEYTQSMGEWYTLMLSQLNSNTTIIGSQTAGADGDLKKINLPGNYQFVFTGNGIYYPDGRKTQRVGIKPDIRYNPSGEDLTGSKDKQLEKAIEFLKH